MKSKAWFLIKQSIKKKMDTKWFRVVNVLLCILLIGVINIDKIINVFGGDFKETINIYLTGDNNYLEGFNAYFDTNKRILNDERTYEVAYSSDDVDTLKSKINDTDDIIVNISYDEIEYLKADIISYNKIDTVTYNLLSSSLTGMKSSVALNYNGLSSEELAKITSPISINRVITNEKDITASEDATNMSLIVFLVPFFMLIVLLVQMIGAEINDEKTTRGMEIIISNVPAKVHFLSKIASSTIFVILQSLLLFLYSGIGILIHGGIGTGVGESNIIGNLFTSLKASGTLNLLANGAPILIIIFLLSFFIYATLAGVLASMTTSTEDFQQLQTPIMVISLLGFYLSMASSMFDGSVFIRIMSYLPFISLFLSPALFLVGQITLADVSISVLVMVVLIFLLYKYGLKIYKVGILNYSSSDLWKKIFKAIKS